MIKKKLTLDKLVIGSLSDAQKANIRGGEEAASRVLINTVCIGSTTAPPKTSFMAGCPVTTAPPAQSVMTCPITTPPTTQP